MDREQTKGKELLRVTPSEAANIVLDDILSDSEKELKARQAVKDTESEMYDALIPAFLIGNVVCSAVYGTIETGINEMANSFMEKVYSPLGFMPKSQYDPEIDVYDDNTEQTLISVDPGNMLIELGALVLCTIRGSYTHDEAKEAVKEAKIRASTPGEPVPAYTPRGLEQMPSEPSKDPVHVTSNMTIITQTPSQKIPQGNM